MSFYESEDYLNSEVELDANESVGLIMLPGVSSFADLAEPGQIEDYDPRYSISFRVPKGHESFRRLLAVCDHIGRKTWKGNADEMLEGCWDCIDKGVSPKNSNISIQDGDLYQTEYNSGTWLIKAARRPDEGRPSLYDKDTHLIFTPNDLDEDTGEIINGSLVGDENQIVKNGDLCVVLIRVWAQKKRERLNFSLQGVQFVKRGSSGARAIQAQVQTAALFSGSELPAIGSGMDDDDDDGAMALTRVPAKKSAPKKAAAKKAAPKKAAGKTRGSVFKKKA